MNIKILTVVYSFGKGGTQRTAQNFAIGYSRIGCDSRVLGTRLNGPRSQYLHEEGIPLYFLDNKLNCQEISEWCPDVVHVHSHGIDSSQFDLIRSLCDRAKFVETNVFSCPSPWSQDLLISYQLSHWCHWLFSTRSNHQFYSEVLPNAVDTNSFCRSSLANRIAFRSKYGLLESDLIIGRVGQSFEGKWSPFLVDVFEEIRKNTHNLKLLLVNPPRSVLKRSCSSRFSSDIIHIDRLDGDTSLADCYSSIDVFVLIAGQGESFGMVLSESLLCETPVVTVATPWADNSQGEVVGNCIGGFVASTKCELRWLIEKLLFNPKTRVLMGRAGRDRIINMFSSQAVCRKSLALIKAAEFTPSSTNITTSPTEIFSDCIGQVTIFSKLLLKAGRFFWLLEYTLGYSSWLQLIFVRIPLKLKKSFCYAFRFK